MDAMLDLVTLLIFIGVILLIFLLRSLSGKRNIQEATHLRFTALKKHLQGSSSVDTSKRQDKAENILREIDNVAVLALPIIGKTLAAIWLNINVIGWKDKIAYRLSLQLIISIALAALLASHTTQNILIASLLSSVFFILIFTITYNKALAKYHHDFKQALPEAIDAITRAARAGMPVSNTFSLVAENIVGPLAIEFRLIDTWMKLGIPIREALQDSAKRITLNEYRFFVVILIINQESGGRLGETLERLSATLRDRHELHLKIQAKTSEARASAQIVAALVPLALGYMYMNSPTDFAFMFDDPTGNNVLIYAFCSVTFGLAITRIMVRRIS